MNLTFIELLEYDTLESGITVPVKLNSGDVEVILDAKLDTGSTHCIFERGHGERLELDVEAGTEFYFGTATGRFLTFGHELTISILGIESYITVYFIAEEAIKKNVLGRIGWLDRVQIGLVDYEGKLYLNSYQT
ncbi:MAG: hypothetical protein ACR2J3_12170 [Aridibacter sp.]